MTDRRGTLRLKLAYLVTFLFFSTICCTTIGPVYIPIQEIASILSSQLAPHSSINSTHATIMIKLRMPRIVLGILTGMALAVGGVVMQSLFRNPMADPYVIGVSSGAALGAAVSLTILPLFIGVYTVPLMAFLSGMATVLLVYRISRVGSNLRTDTLLLAGIAISYLASAALSILVWCLGEEKHMVIFWVMGGLWRAEWLSVKIAFLPVLAGCVVCYLFSREMNIMLLGEEQAVSLGVKTEMVKRILLITSSLMTSTVVSFTGIIGFVGLMIPHIMRLLVGPDHRVLLPSSALAGGAFLIWADAVARCLMEVPVGVITALSGIPFFIYLLRKRRRGLLSS